MMITRASKMWAMATIGAMALAGALMGVAGGCVAGGAPGYYAGGNLATNDRFVYESTRDLPMTVRLRDQRSGEVIWSFDIPEGQQLVIDFDEADGYEQEGPGPDTMRWASMPLGTHFGSLVNKIQVPTASDRMLEPMIRR
jgi:hypothetical protein